jgi:cell pole-organizing protein PopZ
MSSADLNKIESMDSYQEEETSSNEASMEEILSSIRQIFADESEEIKAEPAKTEPASEHPAKVSVSDLHLNNTETLIKAPSVSKSPPIKQPPLHQTPPTVTTATSPSNEMDMALALAKTEEANGRVASTEPKIMARAKQTKVSSDLSKVLFDSLKNKPSKINAPHSIDETSNEAVGVEKKPSPLEAMGVNTASKTSTTSEPLLSNSASQSIETAFQNLAEAKINKRLDAIGNEFDAKINETINASVEPQIEALLKPMLKAWLDQNLPNMVERIVEREIKRITDN